MNNPDYALITGASAGIGESFARALAARGKNLVIVARSREKLTNLAQELKTKHGTDVEVASVDLSEPGAPARLVQSLVDCHITIDLLVNNAGFGARGEFWKLPLERQTEMIRLNVLGLVELTYLLLPPMLERRRGSIINTSSTASFQPVPYTGIYAATKAFVTNFSLALEEELRAYGVQVVTLCPGGTATNFFEASGYGMRSLPGGLQSPEDVVKEALKALDRRAGLVVPRLINKLSLFVQRFVPRKLVVKIAGDMFKP
jgi:uncharacterized protein